jgi:2-keto-4-pentenoate hydratase/2-oxohepta-3-ene-1,7-dioic acid hydratase in catechol pathway
LSPQRTFALGTFALADRQLAGLVVGDRVFDLGARLGPDTTVRSLLEDWDAGFAAARRLADELDGAAADFELAELRPLPPVRPCGQVFQAAANYRQHVLELIAGAERRGDDSDGMAGGNREDARAVLDERVASGRPFVFMGSAHTMVGAEDAVVLPSDSEQSDWELELAAVIGRPARRLPPERALEAVAGYTICNDLTSRDALARWDAGALGIDWLAGKNSPTFLPAGPLLVPAAFVADPMDLRIELSVNGRTMQDETTADMLFDVASLISHISTVAELRPGDFVLTGSPAGNGASHGVFLRPGDVIEASITGLGAQRNRCVAEGHDDSNTAADLAPNSTEVAR